MNVSFFTMRKVVLYLIFFLVPLISHGQFYKFFEVLVDDTLSYEFESVQYDGSLTTPPNHGTAEVLPTANGNIFELVYTPASGYIGRDTLVITYYIYPITARQRTVEIEVLPSIIKAYNDYEATTVDTPVTLTVLDNDVGSDTISIHNVSLTNNGAVVINTDQSITFTPDSGFVGDAYFNYTICLSSGKCDVGIATVFVEENISLVDTVYLATRRGVAKEVTLPLDNGYQQLQNCSNGVLTEHAEGWISYGPNASFYGAQDTFKYTYNTNTVSSIRTFIIDVLDTPLSSTQGIAFDDYAYVIIDGEIDIDVLANDNQLLDPYISLIGTQPLNGIAAISGGKINYIPNSGFTGVDKFSYKSCILPAGCENADVYVIVDNQFPSSTSYDLTTIENTPLVINYQIPIEEFDFVVTSNLSDEEGTVDYHSGYFNGLVHGQQVAGYNLIVYTPPLDYTGLDHFEFEYCVGSDCELVKIDMDVIGMSNPPIDTFCVGECVWAGDANFDGTVNINDLLPVGYCIGEVGISRQNGSIDWYAQFGDNWDGHISQTAVNIKHVDGDGDGFITAGDTTALKENYGKTHNLTPGPGPVSSSLPLYFVPRTPGPYNPGDLVVTDIFLGNSSAPAIDMYGLTFAMNYNPTVVDSGSFQVSFDQSNWMAYNSPMLDMIEEPTTGRVEVGYTRTSGVAASGYGKIGSFSFIVVDDIIDGVKRGDTLSTNISGTAPVYMNALGIYQQMPVFDIEIEIAFPGQNQQGLKDDQVVVYPNPTQDALQVHVNGNNEIRELYIYSLTGQRLFASGKIQEKATSIDLSRFENGLYILNTITENGIVSRKIEVIR